MTIRDDGGVMISAEVAVMVGEKPPYCSMERPKPAGKSGAAGPSAGRAVKSKGN